MAKTKQEAGEQTALLDKPRVLFSEPGGGAQVLFYGVLLALGCTGALGCFFGAFQVPVAPLPALGVGAVCLAFSLFLFLTKKPSWVASLVGIALWVGAVWYFFEDLVQGCAHTVNLVLEAYGNRLGVLMPQMATDPALTQGQIQQQCTVFCCLLTFPYLFFLGWALAGHKSAFGTFCLTGLPLCVPMLISLVPPAPYVAALLLFWAVLLLFSPSFGKRHRLLEDHGRYHAAGNNLARPSMLGLFLAGVALCMGLTYCLVPYSTYQRPQVAVDLWNGLSRGFGIQSSLRGGVGSGNSRVNLNSLGARSYTGETVLRVQYQWQEPEAQGAELPTNREKDYLKSFVGSVYTGESWERLSDEDQRELSNLLQGQRPQTLPDQFSQLFTPLNSYRYQVSVENVSANPRCVYTPYGLVESTVDTAQMEFVDDGFLQSSHFFGGTPTYTLEGWGLSNSLAYYPSQVQSSLLEGYANSQGYSASDIDYWSQVPGMADIMDANRRAVFPKRGVFGGKPRPVENPCGLGAVPQPPAAGAGPDRGSLQRFCLRALHPAPPGAGGHLADLSNRKPPEQRRLLRALLRPLRPQPLYPNPTAYPADCQHPGGPVRLHLDTPGPAGRGGLCGVLSAGEPPGVLRPLCHSGHGVAAGHGHPRPVCGGLRRPRRGGGLGGRARLQRPRLGGGVLWGRRLDPL